jgi:transglutaminase-like putative cysteine protease
VKRDVSARIVLSVSEPASMVFSVAVAADYRPAAELLSITQAGVALEPEAVADLQGTRLHRVEASAGELVLVYSASIEGRLAPAGSEPVDLVRYVRPSRYAESDLLGPTTTAEFAGLDPGTELLEAVSSWVGTRLAYVSGSSLHTDGAARTLLARQGVCRDFAHLCVALLRALGVPARLVSVYAPGLQPMDFHAVAEALIDDAWWVVDATTLAPRASLVRIATGRDAADTAFLTMLSGRAELVDLEVAAVADVLPDDDVTKRMAIG